MGVAPHRRVVGIRKPFGTGFWEVFAVTVGVPIESCLTEGVQSATWEQLGNKHRRKPYKTVLHDIGKGQTIQPHSVFQFTLQAGAAGSIPATSTNDLPAIPITI